MKLKDWFKFFHKFFITTGFIALFTIMCSANTPANVVADASDEQLINQCENKRWIADLLYMPGAKKILLCPDVDKIVSQNSISNR